MSTYWLRALATALGVLLAGLLVSSARAGATDARILVVDPGQSETGDYCADAVQRTPGLSLTRIDLSQLDQAQGKQWDVVVWVWPQPSHFADAVLSFWKRVAADASTGVMILGLPQDEPGRAAVFDALSRRGTPKQGVHFGPQFSGSRWIWTSDSPKSRSRVYLRKTFDLPRRPSRAWMQLCGDNQATLWLNGRKLGETGNWQQPLTLDVLGDLREGTNAIAIEGFNEDGYAGVLFSLFAIDESGVMLASVASDKSWAGSEALTNRWNEADFDPAGWQPASELAVAGEGPWQRMVQDDNRFRESPIQVAGRHPIMAGLSGALGRANITDGLMAGDGGAAVLTAGPIAVGVAGKGAGGSCVMISADSERASVNLADPDLLNAERFSQVIARSVLWLANRDLSQSAIASPALTTASTPASAPTVGAFPIAVELSPVPRDGVPTASVVMRSPAVLRRTVDEMIEHGFSTLLSPVNLPEASLRHAEEYAESRGMAITYNGSGGIELFGRDAPPAVSVFSRDYPGAVAERLASIKPTLNRYTRLSHGIMYQDEPFHMGFGSFDYSDDAKREFQRRYGYAMPDDPQAARLDPKKWLDLLNFQSDSFSHGFRQAYRLIKQAYPKMSVILTHDSHNTFGGGVGQEAQIAIDDVFHWGGDFADVYAFDIYPYVMNDFRYGPDRQTMRPRMAQAHFAFAQMRNLAQSNGRKMGYWFDCFNAKWFPNLSQAHRDKYWIERVMAYSGIAQGADYLLAAAGIPEDRKHWDDLGQGLRTIQKVGDALLRCPKLRAPAAFVFPRTQYLQLQQEYWNVAQSYELFLRALGELDVIHEEQLMTGQLAKYRMLILCDVELLPRAASDAVAAFVRKGGIVVADCVPRMDEHKQPLETMSQLFGVSDPQGGRVLWPVAGQPERPPVTARARGKALGVTLDLPVVSPRPAKPQGASIVLKLDSSAPALMTNRPDGGRTYLLGFCLQDTLSRAYQEDDASAQQQLADLASAVMRDANVAAHVRCSNPDVAVAVRANSREGFLFVIAHEPRDPAAKVRMSSLPFAVKRVVDVATGSEIPFRASGTAVELEVWAPTGTTHLYQLEPRKGGIAG